MPYNPYSPKTNGRQRNPKSAAISGVPALPLYDSGANIIPSVVITNFSLTGGSGSNPTVTWHLLNGGDVNTTYQVYLFGGVNPQPVYPRDVVSFPSGLGTTYTSTVTTTANWYYFFLIVATNIAGVTEVVSSILQTPFNPASLTAPLIAWFKGDSGLTSSTWTNNGTNGGSATLTGATLTTINGLSAVTFKAGSGYGFYTQNYTGQPHAVFWVIKFNADISATNVTTLAGAFSVPDSFVQIYTSGGQQTMVLSSFGASTSIQTDVFSANQTSLPAVFGEFASATAANNLAYYNGTSLNLTTRNAASGYSTGNRTAYLGAYNNGTPGPNSTAITWCEVLCYDGELTSTDMTNVVTYLRNKWGTA